VPGSCSRYERQRLAKENPSLLNNDISRILGKKWYEMSASEKQPFVEQALALKQFHQETNPLYRCAFMQLLQVVWGF
jgi:hypothetical protein